MKHLQNRKNKAAGLTPNKEQEAPDEFEAAEVESCNDSDITQPEEVVFYFFKLNSFVFFSLVFDF